MTSASLRRECAVSVPYMCRTELFNVVLYYTIMCSYMRDDIKIILQ